MGIEIFQNWTVLSTSVSWKVGIPNNNNIIDFRWNALTVLHRIYMLGHQIGECFISSTQNGFNLSVHVRTGYLHSSNKNSNNNFIAIIKNYFGPNCCSCFLLLLFLFIYRLYKITLEKLLHIFFSFLYSFVLNYVIDEGVSPLGKTTFQSRLQACKHLGMVCWLQFLLLNKGTVLLKFASVVW